VKIERNISIHYFGLKRRFADTLFVSRLYIVWVTLAFVTIGLSGILPLAKNIIEKKLLVDRLGEVNADLSENIRQSVALKNKEPIGEELANQLNLYLPSSVASEEYINELSQAAGESGFLLVNVTVSGFDSDAPGLKPVKINARLTGTGSLPVLVNKIESLKRITEIQEIRYGGNLRANVKGDANVYLYLEIYSL